MVGAEVQDPAVVGLFQLGGALHQDLAAFSVKIGQRHEQVEPLAARKKAGTRLPMGIHVRAGIEHPAREAFVGKGRGEPAQLDEGAQFLPCLGIVDLTFQCGGDSPVDDGGDRALEIPDEPVLGLGEAGNIGIFEPQDAMIGERQVVGARGRA